VVQEMMFQELLDYSNREIIKALTIEPALLKSSVGSYNSAIAHSLVFQEKLKDDWQRHIAAYSIPLRSLIIDSASAKPTRPPSGVNAIENAYARLGILHAG